MKLLSILVSLCIIFPIIRGHCDSGECIEVNNDSEKEFLIRRGKWHQDQGDGRLINVIVQINDEIRTNIQVKRSSLKEVFMAFKIQAIEKLEIASKDILEDKEEISKLATKCGLYNTKRELVSFHVLEIVLEIIVGEIVLEINVIPVAADDTSAATGMTLISNTIKYVMYVQLLTSLGVKYNDFGRR
jgi:hypothetical protein